MSQSPFSPGTKILGGGALLLATFLFIGFLMPGRWQAGASQFMAASPERVLEFLDSPEGWQQWTPWPENGVERTGPARGPGARLAWDDPELGSGSFTLGATSAERVEYSIDIDDGAMQSTGVVTITAQGDGVLVDWREAGDLGWNPLMGYWALSMGRAQGEELGKSLARLSSLVGGPPGPP